MDLTAREWLRCRGDVPLDAIQYNNFINIMRIIEVKVQNHPLFHLARQKGVPTGVFAHYKEALKRPAFDPFRTVISRVRTVILRVQTVISRDNSILGKYNLQSMLYCICQLSIYKVSYEIYNKKGALPSIFIDVAGERRGGNYRRIMRPKTMTTSYHCDAAASLRPSSNQQDRPTR